VIAMCSPCEEKGLEPGDISERMTERIDILFLTNIFSDKKIKSIY
jgi:hypothetical protein